MVTFVISLSLYSIYFIQNIEKIFLFWIILFFGNFYYKSLLKLNWYSFFLNRIKLERFLFYFILLWISLFIYSLFLFLELNILSFIIKISYFIFMGLSLSFSFFLFLSILKNSFGNKYLSLNKIIAFIYQKTDLNIELILQALNVFDSSNSSKKLFWAGKLFRLFFFLKIFYIFGSVLIFFNIKFLFLIVYLDYFKILSNLLLPSIFVLSLKPLNAFCFFRNKVTGHTVYSYLYFITSFWLVAFLFILIYNLFFFCFIFCFGKNFMFNLTIEKSIIFMFQILKDFFTTYTLHFLNQIYG